VHPNLERLRGTVGLWTLSHENVEPSRIREVTSRIEAAGFRALWVPEAYGREAMTGAQLLLGASTSLVVGTGIASIYARDAMAASSASKTLAESSSDRFILGLGVSHRPLVERARKGTYEPPIAAMTRYLDDLDSAPVTSAERDTAVPVVLAALGPKMLGLASARTSGVLSYLVTTEHSSIARDVLGPDGFLAVEQSVVLGETRGEFLRRAHEHLNFYTGLENYRSSWRRLGFDDSDFVRGGSDRLCDEIVVHGDVDAIERRVRSHFDAGADHVCLQVLGSTMEETPLRSWDELGAALCGS
jgi:probable F420-dependent oxidoreductase